MFRHDPAVMLHAPLLTVATPTWTATRPPPSTNRSRLFASYDNPLITAVW